MEQIETCKRCTQRKFDFQKGVLCGLTGEKPKFELTCESFVADKQVQEETAKLTRPNKKRAKSAIIWIGIVLALDVFGFFAEFLNYKVLSAKVAGEFVSEEMVGINDLRQGLVALAGLIALIVSAVMFIRWFRRAYYNLNQRAGSTEFDDSWAAGAWFVPIVNFFRPYQIMKEMWTDINERLKRKDTNYIEKNMTLVGIWWGLWISVGIIENILGRIEFRAEDAETLLNVSMGNLLLFIPNIPLAILAMKVVREYNKMELQLGEVEPMLDY